MSLEECLESIDTTYKKEKKKRTRERNKIILGEIKDYFTCELAPDELLWKIIGVTSIPLLYSTYKLDEIVNKIKETNSPHKLANIINTHNFLFQKEINKGIYNIILNNFEKAITPEYQDKIFNVVKEGLLKDIKGATIFLGGVGVICTIPLFYTVAQIIKKAYETTRVYNKAIRNMNKFTEKAKDTLQEIHKFNEKKGEVFTKVIINTLENTLYFSDPKVKKIEEYQNLEKEDICKTLNKYNKNPRTTLWQIIDHT